MRSFAPQIPGFMQRSRVAEIASAWPRQPTPLLTGFDLEPVGSQLPHLPTQLFHILPKLYSLLLR